MHLARSVTPEKTIRSCLEQINVANGAWISNFAEIQLKILRYCKQLLQTYLSINLIFIGNVYATPWIWSNAKFYGVPTRVPIDVGHGVKRVNHIVVSENMQRFIS